MGEADTRPNADSFPLRAVTALLEGGLHPGAIVATEALVLGELRSAEQEARQWDASVPHLRSMRCVGGGVLGKAVPQGAVGTAAGAEGELGLRCQAEGCGVGCCSVRPSQVGLLRGSVSSPCVLRLLSVGYSTCHWCHVMEEESFKNQEIGEIMSKNFVCIKVDREERPDVDKVYMTFVQVGAGLGHALPFSLEVHFCVPEEPPVRSLCPVSPRPPAVEGDGR